MTCYPTKSGITVSPPLEEAVTELRQGGMSIANIMKATGLPERQIKQLTANITKSAKKKQKSSKTITPLSKATEQVFILATRKCGIRDYELREILHEVYGSTWDTSAGYYSSNYDSAKIKRVRTKVRERANKEGSNAIFVMDWIDEQQPTPSRVFLERAALALEAKISELISEFTHLHSTRNYEDDDAAKLARRKQGYAARRYLLKMAIKEYHPEPTEVLMNRAIAVTNMLDGIADLDAPEIIQSESNEARVMFYPAPSSSDPFLDHVESQGWLKEVIHRLI